MVSHGGGRTLLLYFDRNVAVVAWPFFCNFREYLVNHEALAHFLIYGIDGVGGDCVSWSISAVALSRLHDNKTPSANLPIILPIIYCDPTSLGNCSK